MQYTTIYQQRINLVINYIREHLDGDLSLDTLARVAYFSPFHFHRLFKSLTGETVNDCVVRLRLERAVALLKASPTLPLLDASVEAGFNSASNFSRSFKQRYGINPRRWDRQTPLKNSKNRQVLEGASAYTLEDLANSRGEFEVTVRTQPAHQLAYIRVRDPYSSEHVVVAYERLIAWYCQRGGDLNRATLMGISQNDPDVTPLELCTYDISVVVPKVWEDDGEVSLRHVPECQLVSLHCVGDIYAEDKAWQFLFRYWLPNSHYQPDNLPALEIYRRLPSETGWTQFDMDCAIPVVAL